VNFHFLIFNFYSIYNDLIFNDAGWEDGIWRLFGFCLSVIALATAGILISVVSLKFGF